jgi:hypothetical protein
MYCPHTHVYLYTDISLDTLTHRWSNSHPTCLLEISNPFSPPRLTWNLELSVDGWLEGGHGGGLVELGDASAGWRVGTTLDGWMQEAGGTLARTNQRRKNRFHLWWTHDIIPITTSSSPPWSSTLIASMLCSIANNVHLLLATSACRAYGSGGADNSWCTWGSPLPSHTPIGQPQSSFELFLCKFYTN